MGADGGFLDLQGGILESLVGASSKEMSDLKDATHNKHGIGLPKENVSVAENPGR